MKPEKQNLIHDVLDDDSNRERIMVAGNRILRRRRHWRVARQTALMLAVVTAVAVSVLRKESAPQRPPQMAQAAPETGASVPQVRALSDDELLALFPNTPVGLASHPNGKKQLIFPRAGDAARFITRL